MRKYFLSIEQWSRSAHCRFSFNAHLIFNTNRTYIANNSYNAYASYSADMYYL